MGFTPKNVGQLLSHYFSEYEGILSYLLELLTFAYVTNTENQLKKINVEKIVLLSGSTQEDS